MSLAEGIANDYLGGKAFKEIEDELKIGVINKRKIFETLVEKNFGLACKLREKLDKEGFNRSLFDNKRVIELANDFIDLRYKATAGKYGITTTTLYDIIHCRLPFADFKLFEKVLENIRARENVEEKKRLVKLGKRFLRQPKEVSLVAFAYVCGEDPNILNIEFSTKLARYDLLLAVKVKNRLLRRATKGYLLKKPNVEEVASSYVINGATTTADRYKTSKQTVYNYLKEIKETSPLYHKVLAKKKENEKFRGNGARSK